MNYIFFGTPEFAATILRNLIDAGMPPAAVVCNPDKPAGRKKILTPPPTKVIARKFNIPVLQLERLEIGNWASEIEKMKGGPVFDFFVVTAYSKIIPQKMLEIPARGAIGVHPSLLPKYRGPSPIQTALLNGEKKSGVTLYLLDQKTDHGPIVAQRESDIENLAFEAANAKLAELAGNLLTEVLPKYLAGELRPTPQNEAAATYTKKFSSDDGFVDATDLFATVSGKNRKTAEKIERKIRALNPEPGVWTKKGGKRMKLLAAEIKNGLLILKKIQLEGEKPKEFKML